ncbi:MAG: hypothetical protein ACI8UO_006234 [Verrucomicrobiales bacterium]|jgi:uncharacterized protein (DUF58 family)
MIPSRWLIFLIFAWGLVGLVVSILGQPPLIWAGTGVAVGGLALLDLLLVLAQRPLLIRRKPASRFALGVAGEVELEIVNRGLTKARVEIFDGLPADAESDEMPWQGTAPRRGFTEVNYSVKMMKRGLLQFTAAHLRRISPFGLWRHTMLCGESSDVRVYPNYEPIVRYSLLALENQENIMGIVHRNRPGMSRDFHQLREYQEGDLLSQIDWNASSKRLQLISREYREQRDQSIIIMVDCGHRMRAYDGDLPQFDHCLNAVLLTSFIALRQGDKVGVLGFGGANRWQPPVKGQHSMTTLLNHLYDYQTTKEPSDYTEAVEQLMVRQRRRALVIVLTNLRSEDSGDVLLALRLLQRRHVVMLASLREASVQKSVTRRIEGFDDALQFGATHLYLEERARLFEELRGHGILTLDETAKELPVALSNSYLDIKNSGRL